ncbi:MAG TPA: tripartite tricarboxylate transporter substrate binding protein [Burkholderiales bacterium]|nr:tripartite tricarboxylate transporter substrate binding protein [Burkholderiales bacterium]
MRVHDNVLRFAAAVLVPLAAGAAAPALQAQAYPAKPVRLVVPYPPGGGSDTIARPLAQKMSEGLGQQVFVDNRGGANGNIGMELVARSAPDGYTLVFALSAQLAINPGLYRKIPYDPVRDFAPITLFGSGIYILVVHPSLPVKSVKELIALAKARPGEIAYSSSGSGSGGHLAAELFTRMAAIRMLHVPYKGGGPALMDLLAGNVQVLFATQLASWPHIQSGRIRALAVSTAKRPASLPELPTIAESGVPGYDSGVWYALLAPAGTPRDIVTRLNGEVVRVLNQPDYRGFLIKNGIEPIGAPPEELDALIRSEIKKYAKLIQEAGIRVE